MYYSCLYFMPACKLQKSFWACIFHIVPAGNQTRNIKVCQTSSFYLHTVSAISLQHETGVHRVQRVPATEAMGRLHTSTMTVAVLPEPEEVGWKE